MGRRRKRRNLGDPKVAIGYLRASTAEQHLSPAAQRAALHDWCEREGVELVAVHEDLGVSGAADIEDRLALLQALDNLTEAGAGVLLVAKRDRVARDVGAAAMIERLVERNGAVIRCADGNGNGDGPEAMLIKGLLDLFAQYERALIRGRTTAALRAKKARGERTGSVPYGYRLKADGRKLTPDQREQKVVTLVKKLRGQGQTLHAIGDELARRGHRPRGGAGWHPDTISRIARSEPLACT